MPIFSRHRAPAFPYTGAPPGSCSLLPPGAGSTGSTHDCSTVLNRSQRTSSTPPDLRPLENRRSGIDRDHIDTVEVTGSIPVSPTTSMQVRPCARPCILVSGANDRPESGADREQGAPRVIGTTHSIGRGQYFSWVGVTGSSAPGDAPGRAPSRHEVGRGHGCDGRSVGGTRPSDRRLHRGPAGPKRRHAT
jgi:hypothetical protein